MRVQVSGDDSYIGVRVTPSAPRTMLKGIHGDRLKVAVAAPPEDNRANKELEAALAGWFGLSREQVRVTKGHASRDKVVAFKEVGEGRLKAAIEKSLNAVDHRSR